MRKFSERINRVSRMVEALEKYRQRQMANLHESYQKKIGLLRENYHQQVNLYFPVSYLSNFKIN